MPYILSRRHIATKEKEQRAKAPDADARAERNLHTAKIEWEYIPEELALL
jgi:hypothetical protein